MDMNISGRGEPLFPQPQEGNASYVKQTGDAISKMVGSLRQMPRFSASQPATKGSQNNLAPTKALIKTVLQSVVLDAQRAIQTTVHGIVNQCSRMARVELAEAIAEQANALHPDMQALLWRNIAEYAIRLNQKDR